MAMTLEEKEKFVARWRSKYKRSTDHFETVNDPSVEIPEGKVLVKAFQKKYYLVDVELNNKCNIMTGKIIYDKCPCCGCFSQQDLLCHSPGLTILDYACGCKARFEKNKDPVYSMKDVNNGVWVKTEEGVRYVC